MDILAGSLLASTVFPVGGCTHILEIRTSHSGAPHAQADVPNPAFACDTGYPQPDEYINSIEDYGKYFPGYVEFDDQGHGVTTRMLKCRPWSRASSES